MEGFDDEELRHATRLWRVLLDRFLGELEPTGTGEPTLVQKVEQHLGINPLTLPVVTERWAPHEHADVQFGLERWLETTGGAGEIVGTPYHARRHQTFAEMLQFARRDFGYVVGPPDWVHVPVSPDDTHPCVSFGVFLVAGTPPLAILLRGPDPQSGNPFVQLEILTADAEVARSLVTELRRLAIELSPGTAAIRAHRRGFREAVSLPAGMGGGRGPADHAAVGEVRPRAEHASWVLIVAAQDRWGRVNAPHLVALVRAGATFVNGRLVEHGDAGQDAAA